LVGDDVGVELKDYIAKGERIDPADSEGFDSWVNFCSGHVEEHYGVAHKSAFISKTMLTTPVLDFEEGEPMFSMEERRACINKGIKYLKSLEGYPVEENTILKKKNRRDNTVSSHPIVNIENKNFVNVSVEQALVALEQQVQILPPEQKSNAMKALERVGRFLGVAVGTAAGQVLKDKM